MMKICGFIVHCYADSRRDRLYLIGRLEDGRSFAAAEKKWRPDLHIFDKDTKWAEGLLAAIPHESVKSELEAFESAEKLLRL